MWIQVFQEKQLFQQLVSVRGCALIPCYRYSIWFIPTQFMYLPTAISPEDFWAESKVRARDLSTVAFLIWWLFKGNFLPHPLLFLALVSRFFPTSLGKVTLNNSEEHNSLSDFHHVEKCKLFHAEKKPWKTLFCEISLHQLKRKKSAKISISP